MSYDQLVEFLLAPSAVGLMLCLAEHFLSSLKKN